MVIQSNQAAFKSNWSSSGTYFCPTSSGILFSKSTSYGLVVGPIKKLFVGHTKCSMQLSQVSSIFESHSLFVKYSHLLRFRILFFVLWEINLKSNIWISVKSKSITCFFFFKRVWRIFRLQKITGISYYFYRQKQM